MKKTKVKFAAAYSTGYLYNGAEFTMAWVKKSVEKGYGFTPCFDNAFHGCRETFASSFVNTLSSNNSNHGKIPKDKIRVLVMATGGFRPKNKKTENWYKGMQNGVRALNALESECGWSLTTIKKVSNPELGENGKCAVVVIGSPKWLKSTQLMSMFLLILRSGKGQYVSMIKSVSDISKMMEKLEKVKPGSGDPSHVVRSASAWLKIMRHSAELFRVERQHKFYSGAHGITGMLSTVYNSSFATKAMRERWKEIDKKYAE